MKKELALEVISNVIDSNCFEISEIEEIGKALDMQIPQQPTETQELIDIEWLCPVCGFQVGDSFGINDYCGGCGQRIG